MATNPEKKKFLTNRVLESVAQRRDILTGNICIVTGVAALLFGLGAISFSSELALVSWILTALMIGVYFIHKMGYTVLAKYSLLLCAYGSIGAMYIVCLPFANLKVFFLGINVFPLLVLSYDRWKSIILFLGLGFSLFAAGLYFNADFSNIKHLIATTIAELFMGIMPCAYIAYLNIHNDTTYKFLDEKDKYFNSVFESIEAAIITIDSRGDIVSSNRYVEKLLGWQREEMIGRNVRMLMPMGIAEEHDGYLSRFLATGESKIIGIGRRVEVKRKDDSFFQAYLNIAPFKIGTEVFFTGNVADITNLVEHEQTLLEQKAHLNELLKSKIQEVKEKEYMQELLHKQMIQQLNFIRNAPVAIAMVDTNLNYITWSRSWENDYNLKGKIYKGANHSVIFQGLSEEWMILYERCLRGEKFSRNEDFYEDDAGDPHWLKWVIQPWHDENGEIGGITMLSEDITLRKTAENQMKKVNRLLVNTIDWVWEIDLNFKLVSSEGRLAQVFGLEKDDSILQIFIESNSRKAFLDAFESSMKIREIGTSLEVAAMKPSGEVIYLMIGFVANEDQFGHVIGYHGIAKDITPHKDMVRSLTDAKQEAEAANRSKSLFLANISHEIRTPLHGVLSFAEIAANDLNDQEYDSVQDSISEIRVTGQRLLAILNDLLDLSKLEAGKIDYTFQGVSIHTIIANVNSEFAQLLRDKSLALDLTCCDDEVLIWGDEHRLHQVISNIVSNAIKFSYADTSIGVTCHDAGEFVQIDIRNKGIGVPESELSTIFQKFVQSSKTDRGSGGTGLGLSICQRIVEDHGGTIWASIDGEWTVFSFKVLKESSNQRLQEEGA